MVAFCFALFCFFFSQKAFDFSKVVCFEIEEIDLNLVTVPLPLPLPSNRNNKDSQSKQNMISREHSEFKD